MTTKNVIVRFSGQDDVTSTAKKVEESVAHVGEASTSVGTKFSGLQTVMNGALTQIGMSLTNLATNLGGMALSAVSDFVSGSLNEAKEWNSVFAQTEAVVKSTGAAAGLSATQMADMASAMSASAGKSIFSDDAILGAQNVLATFTQIKGVQFQGATQAILDMSQALGTDLQGATIQVGKALNDPIKGISALSKVGVSFTDEQKGLIETLVKTGDTAGAQKVILDELSKEFGGSAAAAVSTYAGQQVVLQERLAGIQQTLGEALMPVIMKLTGWLADIAIPVIQDIVLQFSDWLNAMNDFGQISEILTWVSDAFTTVQTAVMSLGPVLQSVQTFVQPVVDAFMNLVSAITPALESLGNAISTTIASPAYQGAIAALLPMLEALATLVRDLLVAAFNQAALAWTVLTSTFQTAWPYIQTVLDSFYSLVTIVFSSMTGIFTALSQLINGDFSGAWTTLSTTVQTAVTSLWTWVQTTFAKVDTFLGEIGTKFSKIGTQIVNGIAKGISDGASRVKEAAISAANAAYEAMKEALGIASPSRVMSERIGLPISQGVASGILRGTGAIQTASGLAVQAGASSTVNNYYQLTASYNQSQSEGSIVSDLQRMQVQFGGVL